MSESPQAVFLSYASQDAEAAQRICEALRTAGVEVWFDQNELVGGDAWDAKIRKQIAECALFVPVISANTQARLEGYFRIEWKLAAQRTHAMADEKAFLLPIVIDATRDAEAKVPAEFKAVQWTRLPDGEAAEKFCARVQQLLGSSAVLQTALEPGERGLKPRATPKPSRPWLVSAALVLAAVIALAIWQPWKKSAPPAAETKPARPLTEAQQLVEKARKILDEGDELNRETYVFGEELLKKAEALDLTDATAWSLHAGLSSRMIQYGFDYSQGRREALQAQADRVAKLAPGTPDAEVALAYAQIVARQDISGLQGRLTKLLDKFPNDSHLSRVLSIAGMWNPEIEVALASTRRALQAAPDNPEIKADLIYILSRHGRYAEAEQAMRGALTGRQTARLWDCAWLSKMMWRADVDGAVAAIEQWPSWFLAEDRGCSNAAMTYLWARKPARMLAVLEKFPREYIRNAAYYGPRAVLTAWAHEAAGENEAALADWRIVVQLADRELASSPDDTWAMHWKAWALARLGDRDAAKKYLRILEERDANIANTISRMIGNFAGLALVADSKDAAIERLTRYLTSGETTALGKLRPLTRAMLRVNPLLESLHGDPRYEALVAKAPGPEEMITTSVAPDKSVAVLAFDNRSDDKDAEYFSDGISEELINTLGRVPGLTVRGRTSAFFFKGKNATAREIGEKLGVAYLVRGSVRKADGKVRITAQLSRAATDEVVWTSEPITKELKDVFAVQDEIVGLIAKNLSVSMGVAARAPHPVNPEALTALLEGRHFWVLRTTEGFARARELFNRAVALDPQWAPARAALANLLTIEASFLKGSGAAAGELFASATREAKRAIELDATLGEPHAALGKIAMEDGRYAEAGESFRRALALEPNNAMVHDWHADLMVTVGRLDVAIPGYRRALELDPLAPYIHWDLAWELLHVRRYAEALALVERAAALTPTGSPRLTIRRARLLLELGRRAEAEAILRPYLTASKSESDPQFANEAVWCLRALGSHADSERWATDLLRQYPESFSSGVIWLMRGDTEKAFRLLEKTPTIFQQQLYWDPVFDPVRDTSRFRQLLEKIGCAAEYKVARETLARLLEQSADLK